MELFYISVFIVQASLYAYSVKLFHDTYFDNVERGKPIHRFFSYLLIGASSFASVYVPLPVITNIMLSVISLSFPIFLVKTSQLQKFLCYIFALMFGFTVESAFCSFATFMMGLSNNIPNSRSFEAVIMMLGSRLLFIILIWFFKFYTFNKSQKGLVENKINFKQSIFYIINTVLALSTTVYLFFMINFFIDENQVQNAVILYLLVMFFLISNFISYIQNLDLHQYQTKALLLNQEMEHYSREHQLLGEYLKEISVLKHDMKYKLLPILAKLPSENQDILNEFSNVFDAVFFENYQYFTTNSTVDLLLNHHIFKARQENIKLDIQIEPCLDIEVEPQIFSVILGNLFDNARETIVSRETIASRETISNQEDVEDNKITFTLSSQNTNLFLKIENPYEGEITLDKGLPKTTKINKKHHGLGLSSVKKLVEQEGGIFRFSSDNNIFTVEILLLNSKQI